VLAPGSSDEADGSLHRALYYQHMYGSDAPAAAAAAAAAAANAHGGSSSRRNGDSFVGRRGSGGGTAASSSSYRWLEDAITEWQTSQGHMVVAEAVGGGGAAGHQSSGHLGGYTPQQVEEVKLVLRLLPVFFTTVLYW
jgi:hypothetical protein